jgi:hydroxymethylglutaryl-CoA lyase
MATSADVLSSLLKDTPTSPTPINYSFLAPNMKGLESAMSVINSAPATNATHPPIEFSVFAAATESFTRKNLNCTIAESLQRFEPVVTAAKDAGYRVRGYISVVLGCPFEGADVSPHKIAEVATALLEMGCDEISLGDTTGMGTAPRTAALLTSLAKAGLRPEDLAMHFHDTFGQALVNTAISLEHGIRTFDASVGGLGGCPYSPGATGNVATEDMVYFLESLGLDTGVDLDQLTDIGEWISGELGRKNASTVGRAVLGRRKLAS